jgi:hypothetical protein
MMDIDRLLVADMKRIANLGLYDGRAITPYFHACKRNDPNTGTSLLFTRDTGMHSSGWFKNPDYERCHHLSMTFYDPFTGEWAPKNEALTRKWLKAFYGDHMRWTWAEPPTGKYPADTWHYRLFCDEHWQPIKPRGEVYSTEFTEKGWKSFSELKGER